MTRIHNIGHIHNANFAQTQFSTSHSQKQHFLKSWKFTFLWKYSVCGLKFKISEYPIKLSYVTYSPYKYELKRMKTHEIIAKYFWVVFFPSLHELFLKSRKFTFLWKYSVCWLKFKISEYPIKLLYVTYSPYKYELERIKTHEIRAKNFPTFIFSVHCTFEAFALPLKWINFCYLYCTAFLESYLQNFSS